jgi:hypothetical protein
MISIVPLLTELKLRIMHSFKVNSVRHTSFKPEGVPARTLTQRFYGSVEIDMVRPVKAFASILNAVVMEPSGRQ